LLTSSSTCAWPNLLDADSLSQEQIPEDQDMYDDCNVDFKGSFIPVIMQDLRRSKEHINRGAVSSQNSYICLMLLVYSQRARTPSLRSLQDTFV
jgi:hypothetical protein